MATAAEMQAYFDAAAAANESGDYATARSKARSAWIICSALPDSELEGSKLTWERNIQNLIAEIKQAASDSAATSSGGIRRTKITHANVSE